MTTNVFETHFYVYPATFLALHLFELYLSVQKQKNFPEMPPKAPMGARPTMAKGMGKAGAKAPPGKGTHQQ